jgi:F420-non-reducing hydrogenase iron-sulfur subunit
VKLLDCVLDTLGLDRGRVMLKWISASEGRKFAETAKSFTEEIKKLGPSPMTRDI